MSVTLPETDLDQQIWQVVARIPAGYVATYGDVATLAGLPGAARRVGLALRRLPQDTAIPWHRVINAQGRIALRPGRSQYAQRDRLVAEGVSFSRAQRIDLARFRWTP